MTSSTPGGAPRETCLRCRRPTGFCYCHLLPCLTSRTKVLLLRHPRERDMPIGTARIAHLSLPDSTLVEGIALDAHPAVTELLERGDAALLYPGAGARPVSDWAEDPPRALVVVDGTWWQAKKMLEGSPRLAALPRMSLHPDTPSTYRIRKEPTDQHLSTIEALATTLGILEGAPGRFERMLAPFNFMVERQMEAQLRREPRARKAGSRRLNGLLELQAVLEAPEKAVILYAEANSHSRKRRDPGTPELVHLVAVRPATGDRFEAVLKPRRRLGGKVAERLGLPTRALLDGEEVDGFLSRWRSFLGERPEVCAWGPTSVGLLQAESGDRQPFVDLRMLAARSLRGSAGGIERAALRLVGLQPGQETTRGHRMLALLQGILAALVQRAKR